MKLLQELTEDVEFLVEGSGKEKSYYVQGPFLVGDTPNKNKRSYPIPILEKEVDRYVREYVEQKRAFGELNHPQGPIINLDRASHMITSLRREGKNFIGKAKIMDTPMGRIVKTLLDEGAKLGISSRGLGSVKLNENGINEVQNDFYLATAGDIVSDPSAPGAFVQGIMEDKEWLFINGSWTCRDMEETKKILEEANRSQIEDLGLRFFKEYLGKL